MRVTVELTQNDILRAIALFLEEQGVSEDSEGNAFPVEIFYNNEKLTGSSQLKVRVVFHADDFSYGPYR